jgi:uncharacterized membrane protein YjgN (DUF898 family)
VSIDRQFLEANWKLIVTKLANGKITDLKPTKALGGQMFEFEGGAATYWGTALLGGLITILTIGILYPFALVLLERWRAKHSYIDGRQLVFKGSAIGLFGRWLLWLLLIVVTLGIYSFWVIPAIQKWKWDNTKFA